MRRNRPALFVAGVALIGVSVFGATLAANAATPDAPVITTLSQDTLQPSITLTGTVTPTGGPGGTRVEVMNPLVDPTNPVCDIGIPSGTSWTCELPLSIGVNNITAYAYEDDGEPDEFSVDSNQVTIRRGGTQPPSIASPTVTDDPTPHFTGAGPEFGQVSVQWNGNTVLCVGNVDASGQWECDSTLSFVPDTYGGFTPVSELIDASAGLVGEGVSIDIIPATPAMSYSFTPGTASAVGVGPAGSGVGIELYSIYNTGEGYGYTLERGCPTIAPTPDPSDNDMVFGASTVSCAFSGLTPGIWNIYSGSTQSNLYSDVQNDFFRVPTTPTISAKLNDDNSITIRGTAEAGDRIHVQTSSHANVCQTSVVGTAWSCKVTTTPGVKRFVAFSEDQGFVASTGGSGEPADNSYQGLSSYSSTVSVTVPVPPVPVPVVYAPTFGFGSLDELKPGDEFDVDGTDAPPGSTITFEFHSTPITLGSVVAAADGTFSYHGTVPADAEPGDHHIVAIISPLDGSTPVQVEEPVTVVVPDAPEDIPAAQESLGGGAPLTGRQQPGFTSSLTPGFISPAEILSNPLAVVTAGSLGLALVLLVLVPAEFFGEALANHYGTLGGFFARRRGLKRFVEGVHEWVETHRFLAGAALVFVTSVVFCFIDPGFGFDLTSLRLLLSCAASILLVNFLSAGITERVAEKAWKVPTRLEVMPWGLAIAIVGVIASRLLNFSPGFLIGSIIGVSVVGEVTKKFEMRVILLWAGVVWAVAMVSWVLAPVIPVLPASNPAGFITGFITDSLVATSAAGLTALLVALLPIALFDGGELFKASKLWWAVAFGVAVASFSLVVLPSASNWLGLGDGLLRWLLLTLGFIAVAIVTYLIAVRRNGTGRSRLLKSKSQTPAS